MGRERVWWFCLFLKQNLLQVSSVGEWLEEFFTFLVSSTICLQWKLGFHFLAQVKALGCPYKSNGWSMCSQTRRITLFCLHKAFVVDLHSMLFLHKFRMISFWEAKVGHRSPEFTAQATHLPPNKVMDPWGYTYQETEVGKWQESYTFHHLSWDSYIFGEEFTHSKQGNMEIRSSNNRWYWPQVPDKMACFHKQQSMKWANKRKIF